MYLNHPVRTEREAQLELQVADLEGQIAALTFRLNLTEKSQSLSRADNKRLREALHEGRRAIGDHFAPNDCYATGPITGDPIRDLVQCPACSFIAMYDAALSTTASRGGG
tara:strand:+ start:174 stop:503 length:330 start_codon:yes stop_codon:yes gene_type:complete